MAYTVRDAMERIKMYLEKNKGVELTGKDMEVLRGHIVPLATGKEPERVQRTDVVNQEEAKAETEEQASEGD